MADTSLDKAKSAFVDRMGQLASELGLNGSAGSIYALLFMSGEPVSLDRIAQSCAMSKGNASMNVRDLERWGAEYLKSEGKHDVLKYDWEQYLNFADLHFKNSS